MSTHPLSLVEIRHHLGQFLSKRSLKACVLVSRDWRDSFEPWLWSDTEVKWSSPTQTSPPQARLVQNAHMIHRLEFQRGTLHFVAFNQLTCPRLQSLNLLDINPTLISRPLGAPEPILPEERMIERHRANLRHISINLDPWRRDTTRIWAVIASCTQLDQLKITRGKVKRQSWPGCWQALSRVRSLDIEVDFLDAIEEEDEPPWSTFEGCEPARITELTLSCQGLSKMALYQLLKRCPELKALTMSGRTSVAVEGHAIAILVLCLKRLNGCQNLVSLNIPSAHLEADLVNFLETRSQVGLEQLSVATSRFGPVSWSVLKAGIYHSSTLKVLDLKQCDRVSREMVHDILCTLEGLEVFYAPLITNVEMEQDSRPWVSLRLQTLCLTIAVTSRSAQTVVFQRLATLVNLKQLWMDRTRLQSGLLPIRLGLDLGLNLLGNLGSLEELSLQGTDHVVGYDESAWIKAHWPNLQKLLDGAAYPILFGIRKKSTCRRDTQTAAV